MVWNQSLPFNYHLSIVNSQFSIDNYCLRLRCRDSGKQHPSFKAGDTVTVAYRIIEGNKERVQLYRGVVIKIAGHGNKKRFTVRKMSGTVGVERIFPIESPAIDSITVNKVGKVRRAKLYYLRALTGKKARIQEKRVNQ